MKIAATVILYHPTAANISNILKYSHFIETVYVIDNSENPSTEIASDIKQNNKFLYISDCENKGIATRINQACQLALQHGFEWLLTMDQDSAFEGTQMQEYLLCVSRYEQKHQVTMFGVQYEKRTSDTSSCLAIDTNRIITSGSIVNLNLLEVTGGFNESLFIDQVDFEYCYRSILMNFKIIRFDNIFLQHAIGKASDHYSLKTLRKTKRALHHPVRLYYMTRNFLYIKSKYGKLFKNDISESRKDLIVRIKNNLLYGENKTEVIKYILKGIIHYRKKQMGKLC